MRYVSSKCCCDCEGQVSRVHNSRGHHHPIPSHLFCAGYLSAICHDLDHKGLNNDFLIKTSSPLAIQYNDLSPLENHHLAQSFRLLNRDDCGLLSHLSKERQVSAAFTR